MLSLVYRFLTDIGSPVIGAYLRRRRVEGREDAERFAERLGQASCPRPEGYLVWCHAASVGEASSLLILIEKMRDIYPAINILVTTGTVTSARMLGGRLPSRVVHQYVPVDRMPYVQAFLDHWKPDFVLWIESELWPNMLAEIKKRFIPAVLLNARMSEKSFHGWYRVKGWAREILSTFSLCLAQTEDARARFVALGAKPARCFGNLKYAAKALPVDEKSLTELKQNMAGRFCWVMASTHRGEEEIAISTHQKLREKWPGLLTVIVPRHAVRGDEIARLLDTSALPYARRSKEDPISLRTEIYLADTMGELGLFYRLGSIVAMGGSFKPVGGHNPIEPAQLGCAIIFGPHMYNFTEVAREFINHQAAIPLQHDNELAFTVDRLLAAPDDRTQYAQSARVLADQKRYVLDQVLGALEPWLRSSNKKAA